MRAQVVGKQLAIVAFIPLILAAGVVAFVTTASAETAYFLAPALVTIIICAIFAVVLKWQTRGTLSIELGFLYLGLTAAYTILPAMAFMSDALNPEDPLLRLLPAPPELSVHLWRHVLFVFGVALGYLLVRGRSTLGVSPIEHPAGKDDSTIVFLLGMTAICILALSLMSAPVTTYVENYTRYDHLSWGARKFVSVCTRLKLGMYCVLITFLFINLKRYRLITPLVVAIICAYELIYSFGARIESFIVLLIALCSYNYFVKPITLRKGLAALLVIVLLFSTVELLRSYEFDVGQTREVVAERGFKPAYEFGAVFFTGFHLYAERAQGTLPVTEWPMFFNDFISMFTFGDFKRWTPIDWYWRNYYPEAVVPPFTLGPIADSAIWGGEIDLFLRGLVNGAFFAYLVRWLIRRKSQWWAASVYIYCYATCILTFKYSVFFHLAPLFKTMLPTLIVVGLVRSLKLSAHRKLAPVGAVPPSVMPGALK